MQTENLFMTMANVQNVVGNLKKVIKIGKSLIVAIVDNDWSGLKTQESEVSE